MDCGKSQIRVGWYLCISGSLHHNTPCGPTSRKYEIWPKLESTAASYAVDSTFLEKKVVSWMWVSRFLYMPGCLFTPRCMQSRSQTFTFLCCSMHFTADLNLSLIWCSFSPFKTFVIAEIFFLSILMWLYIISNDLFSMSFLSKDWIWEIEKSIMFAEKHYFLFQKFI